MTEEKLLDTLDFVGSCEGKVPGDAVKRFTEYALRECKESIAEGREPDYSTAITFIYFG